MQFGSGAQGPGCRPEFRLTLGSHSASVSVVTIGEPRLGQDEKPASTPREGRLHERIVDWFWRGSEMARVRQALPEAGDRASALAARARTSAELAKNMLASDEPGEISSEDSACEAYRQSSYWALCSLLAREEPTFQPEQGERIWATLDPALLAQAVSDEARIEGLQTALRSGSFVYFAELPKVEQQALLIELRKLSQALLTKLDERSVALDAIYLQRASRLALLALFAICVAVTPMIVKKRLQERSELANSKPWRASSALGEGCTSPAQKCPESPNFFFHTLEEASPWVEFDLRASRKVTRVHVENRVDCCTERADPLVIEVSSDQKRWKRVARHEGVFTEWDAEFSPVQARYLRVRLLKQNYLHLVAVRIY